jgi:hypothetical protein
MQNSECRMMNQGGTPSTASAHHSALPSNVRYLFLPVAAAALWISSAGCADTNKQPTTQPLTLEQRNQKVFDDPMAVGPNEDPSYVAAHGLGNSDKPTLKKEINDFLNP